MLREVLQLVVSALRFLLGAPGRSRRRARQARTRPEDEGRSAWIPSPTSSGIELKLTEAGPANEAASPDEAAPSQAASASQEIKLADNTRIMLTSHGLVLRHILHDSSATLREIALSSGLTERAIYQIICDLEGAGLVVKRRAGRRNLYDVNQERLNNAFQSWEVNSEGRSWKLLSNHGFVLERIVHDPSATLREMARATGLTERAVYQIVCDLEEGGWVQKKRVGRRNAYEVKHQPLESFFGSPTRVVEQTWTSRTEGVAPPPSEEIPPDAEAAATTDTVAGAELEDQGGHEQSASPEISPLPPDSRAGGTVEAVEESHVALVTDPASELPRSGSEPESSPPEARTIAVPSEGPRNSESACAADNGDGRKEARTRSARSERHQEEDRRSTLLPEKRGGRPRGPLTSGMAPAVGTMAPAATRPPQPELVCWEQGRLWYVGLQLPELINSSSVEVVHRGVTLRPELEFPGRYVLEMLAGVVSVRLGADGPEAFQVSLEEPYLIFKLGGEGGRRVDSLGRGWYGIIAPRDWQWDSDHNGPPQLDPQPCSVDDFQMHVFDTSGLPAASVAFVKPGGVLALVRIGKQRFHLSGQVIDDVSTRGGPLFGNVPSLEAPSAKDWDSVGTIVVGEEGSGRGRWRFHFRPAGGGRIQSLPPKLGTRGGGWYFVRLYNPEGALLESLDFRFLAGIQAIEVKPRDPLPGSDGHHMAHIRIVHDGSCTVVPTDPSMLMVKDGDGFTDIEVPAKADLDRVVGQLRRGAVSVHFEVEVPRVWWSVGDEDQEPHDWFDVPLELRRSDFRATSGRVVWIRYPQALNGHRVFAGFKRETALGYRLKKNQRPVLALPLRELGDTPELHTCVRSSLTLWLDTPFQGGCVVGRIALKVKCAMPGCLFEADSIDAVVSHVGASHLDVLVRPVTDYGELREALPELRNLPRCIHRCCKCDKYFPSEENRPDQIFHHDCSKVNPSFEVVRDVERIRRYVLRDLPEVHKCKWGCLLKGSEANDVVAHIVSHHREQLYLVE